jgi:arylsulfatase A-like enzyme
LIDGTKEFERTLFWRMRHRYQRAVRRGGWKYLKVAEREFLFDINYDPRERGDMSKKRPDLLAELRALWEHWDRGMLPLPENAVMPMSNLSAMPW